MSEQAEYKPFGDVLSVEIAYLQAAHVIDVAVQIAVESKDTERLQSLALTWMELGNRLFNGPGDDDDDDDDYEEDERPVKSMGFVGKVEKVDD